VRFLMDTRGVILATYTYDAFGNLIGQTGATPNDYLYCGLQYDWISGLYNNRARRMFAPLGLFTSRDGDYWLNRDPLEEQGGENLYDFVQNDAINDGDAFGCMTLEEVDAMVIAANQAVRNTKCCCKQQQLGVSITGTASGETVTETAKISGENQNNCNAILDFIWWNCFNAQHEEGFWGPAASLEDYGWYLGGESASGTQKGSSGGWWDIHDSHHYNWQLSIIYITCSGGHLEAEKAMSNQSEFTWDSSTESWQGPQNF